MKGATAAVPMPVPASASGMPAPVRPTSATVLRTTFTHVPALEGEVEDVGQLQVLVPVSFASRALRLAIALPLLIFRPLILAGAWAVRGSTPPERRPGYVLTIRRADGGAEQARIERELIGALPRRGDYVSLWGSRSYGVLVVREGYNHSVGGEIKLG
jgi:hypothetical protein